MARKRYINTQVQEAVALGRVIGSDAASAQLGIDPRTITSWMRKAGDPPELDGTAAGWQRLLDLAHSKVVADFSAGRIRAKDAAVIAAISERNLRQLEDRADKRKPGEPTAADAHEAFFEWLIQSLPVDDIPDDEPAASEAMDEYRHAFGALVSELLRRANAELPAERSEWNPPGSHRLALLHWYNREMDTPAGDILDWAKEQTTAIIEEHGSLLGWYRWQEACDQRDVVIRQRAEVLVREGGMHVHDAEPFVREHLADDLPIPEPGAFA